MLPNPATQGGGKDTKLKRQQTFLKLVTFRLHFLPFNGRTLAPQISLFNGTNTKRDDKIEKCLSSFERQPFVAQKMFVSQDDCKPFTIFSLAQNQGDS